METQLLLTPKEIQSDRPSDSKHRLLYVCRSCSKSPETVQDNDDSGDIVLNDSGSDNADEQPQCLSPYDPDIQPQQIHNLKQQISTLTETNEKLTCEIFNLKKQVDSLLQLVDQLVSVNGDGESQAVVDPNNNNILEWKTVPPRAVAVTNYPRDEPTHHENHPPANEWQEKE